MAYILKNANDEPILRDGLGEIPYQEPDDPNNKQDEKQLVAIV